MSRKLFARLDAFWFAPVPALRLAVVRVLIIGFGLIWLVLMSTTLRDTMRLSASHFRPVGVVILIDTPLDAAVLTGLYVLCLVAGIAAMLGWRYRASAPLHALTLLWITTYRNSWGMVFHSENLWVMHALILACLPAADAWSLDARRKLADDEAPDLSSRPSRLSSGPDLSSRPSRLSSGPDLSSRPSRLSSGPDWGYGWGLELMATVTALTYVLAGVAKLRAAGDAWLGGDVLLGHVAWDNLRKLELGAVYSPLGAALSSWPAVFAPLAWLSIALELCAPIALFGRRLAWMWTIGTWSFHIGVAALMAIVFPYPVAGIAFVPLFAVEQPVQALSARIRARTGPGYRMLARLLPDEKGGW